MRLDGKIYADYQATTPIDPRVVETMAQLFSSEIGNPHSSEHFFGWKTAEIVRTSVTTIAKSIGSDSDEIVITSGATESNNLALFGLAKRREAKRRKFLFSAIEHKSILAIARELTRQFDIECVSIPVSSEGIVDVDFIEDKLDDTVLMISVGAVNNEIGIIQPIKEIGTLTKRHGVYFHCDAAQAPCAINIDVVNDNIDLLSLSAHKIYGPQGVGALFVARSVTKAIEPLNYGGGQQGGLRSGTVPVALCAGFEKAVQINSQALQAGSHNSLWQISEAFLKHLRTLGVNFEVNGSLNKALRHPGNCNVRLIGVDSHDVIASLQPRIAISSGSACTSGTPEPSHVLMSIGLSHEEAQSSIRVSFGRFSTLTDAEEVAGGIKMVIENLSA